MAVRLLAWYAAVRRDLPWRHTRDPYAILVSEVMLQQNGTNRADPVARAFSAIGVRFVPVRFDAI